MPEHTVWEGTIELADGKVAPFRMDLDLHTATPSGYFLVGDEKTPIPEISRQGNSLSLKFSEYGAEMRGTWDGSHWAGEYLRFRSSGTLSLKFSASPESSKTGKFFVSGGKLPVGKYQVTFRDKENTATVATIWQKGDSLFGTFIAPDGDYGLLTGQPAGGSIQLSRFTGWQAIAITLEQNGSTWSGNFYARKDKPRPFVLEPRPTLHVETPPAFQTTLKNSEAGFAFEGVSLTGETVRSSDERFKGKTLVLDVMGTWCHNCMDEAPLLQRLQEQFRKDGLEVVGLSFEISDDLETAKKNLRLYKDRFGLTYTILFCGSLDDANVKNRLHAQLDHFFAYPTTMFFTRAGKIFEIHSGFKGPGTGEEFQSQVDEFQQLAAKLVK